MRSSSRIITLIHDCILWVLQGLTFYMTTRRVFLFSLTNLMNDLLVLYNVDKKWIRTGILVLQDEISRKMLLKISLLSKPGHILFIFVGNRLSQIIDPLFCSFMQFKWVRLIKSEGEIASIRIIR